MFMHVCCTQKNKSQKSSCDCVCFRFAVEDEIHLREWTRGPTTNKNTDINICNSHACGFEQTTMRHMCCSFCCVLVVSFAQPTHQQNKNKRNQAPIFRLQIGNTFYTMSCRCTALCSALLKCTRHRFHFSHLRLHTHTPAMLLTVPILQPFIQFNFHSNSFILCRFILFPFDSHNVDDCLHAIHWILRQYCLHVTACLCMNVQFCIRDKLCTKVVLWPISKIRGGNNNNHDDDGDGGNDTGTALYVEFTHSEWACVRQSTAKDRESVGL